MDEKKKTRDEASEEAHRRAEDYPTVRRLRELALRRMTPEEREAFLAEYREAGLNYDYLA